MRWVVMQSMKYKKWVLAVMNESCTAYEVTEIMSENPEKIIQYAEYMNEGKWETKLDEQTKEMLNELIEKCSKMDGNA